MIFSVIANTAMPKLRGILTVAIVSLAWCSIEAADGDEQWTGWLGPERNGWVKDYQPPNTWPKTLKRVWSVKVGIGYASPVVAGGRAYQHGRQGDNEVVTCIDLETGKVQWKKSYAAPFKVGGGGQYHGKGPKSCPVLADGRLLTLSITGVLTAWDARSGKQLWQRDYRSRFKKPHARWGVSTSPVVGGKRVFLHLGTDGQGQLLALDTETGKQVWTHGKDGPSYSSPLLVEIDGVKQVIDWNERVLTGVDAKTGRKLWEIDAPQNFLDQNMPTPTFHKGRILLGAENRGIRGLDPKRENGEWRVHQRWHQKTVALNMSTAVMNGGYLFGHSHYGKGRVFCLDPKSGKVLWQGPPRSGQHMTFLSIPGHIIALVNTGKLEIIKAKSDGFEKVASYRVSEGHTWTPPVLLKRGLLVKDKDTLTLWSLTP